MPDVREVYEMVTKQKPPEPGALQRQWKRQVRAARNKKIGAVAVAAMIALAAVIGLLSIRESAPAPLTPAHSPTATPALSSADALGVATSFMEAFGALNADEELSYLAPNADISGIVSLGDPIMTGTPRDLRLLNSWFEALGYKQMLGACEATGLVSDVMVRCPFEYHLFRSDKVGVGPYGDSSFDVRVRDGAIVQASINIAYETNGFSAKSWEPFANWVSNTHPADAKILYTDGSLSLPNVSGRTLPLWEERIKEYVKEVNRGNVQ